jgi:translation initiation factor 2 subunit 1
MPERNLPEEDDIVVIRITKVLNYGAFAELLEYKGVTGFIHISEVAPGWVKNIRNFVSENQMRAAKVMRVDTKHGEVSLSLTKLSQEAERAKIEEWRQYQRARKLLEMLAKKKNYDPEKAWKEIAEPLTEEYGSIMEAFKEITIHGKSAIKGVDKRWVDDVYKIVKDNISIPKKKLEVKLSVKTYRPDGINIIKKAFLDGLRVNKDVQAYYAGGGTYVLAASDYEYKLAKKKLDSVVHPIIEKLEKQGCMVELRK